MVGAMIHRPWHGTAIFHGIPGVAGNQSLPCVKGGGVRKDTGGIDAEQFTFCNANSDYSMSENPAAHNRKPHTNSSRWGTIPQTLLTQGQPPLHKGAFGAVRSRTCGGRLQVRWGNPSGKIGDFATSRVVDGSVSLVFAQGRKARSLHISSFPHRTHLTAGLRRGPHWGEAEGKKK